MYIVYMNVWLHQDNQGLIYWLLYVHDLIYWLLYVHEYSIPVWTLTNIVWCVARGTEALTFDLFGKAKVSEFQFGSTSEISVEQVLWLWNVG